jgi:hypothetical protein
MEMALDDILEGGRTYSSPMDFLEKEGNQLPEDQEYGVENSTGERKTVDSLQDLIEYLEDVEGRWGDLRAFIPVDADSHFVTYEASDEAEYFGVEFPYTLMETDYNSESAGRIGSIRFGYLSEHEVDEPINIPVSEMSDD